MRVITTHIDGLCNWSSLPVINDDHVSLCSLFLCLHKHPLLPLCVPRWPVIWFLSCVTVAWAHWHLESPGLCAAWSLSASSPCASGQFACQHNSSGKCARESFKIIPLVKMLESIRKVKAKERMFGNINYFLIG